MLATVLNLLTGGLITIGSLVALFGAVQLGLAIKDGATGGGSQIASAIAMIVGGAIVAAAAVLFGQVDISWAN